MPFNSKQPPNSSCSSAFQYLPTEIVQAYGHWIQYQLNLGWDLYWVTFMFRNISGSEDVKIQKMHKEITRVYEKLVTRAVRKPRSDNWVHYLPRGIFFPDVPGYKQSNSTIREVSINDGLHFHGIMVATQEARLKEPLHLHLLRKHKLYVGGKICRLHAEPVTSRAAFVTDYGGKAIKRRRFSYDHVLVLPKTVAELPAKNVNWAESEEAKAIKAIQASTNVSEVVAESIYLTQTSHKRAKPKWQQRT